MKKLTLIAFLMAAGTGFAVADDHGKTMMMDKGMKMEKHHDKANHCWAKNMMEVKDKWHMLTVAQAKEVDHGKYVVIKGHVQKEVSKGMYEFHDETGTIHAQIDTDKWEGMDIKPTDWVAIQAKVDKEKDPVKLHVHCMMKVDEMGWDKMKSDMMKWDKKDWDKKNWDKKEWDKTKSDHMKM